MADTRRNGATSRNGAAKRGGTTSKNGAAKRRGTAQKTKTVHRNGTARKEISSRRQSAGASGQRSRSGISPVFLALATVLVMAATFGGWYLARHFVSDYDKLARNEGQAADYTAEPSSEKKDKKKSPIDTLELIYGYNVSTGRIDELYVRVSRTSGVPAYVSIAPEVSYTMTGDLYRELTLDNLSVPQTVTLSELHRYYDSEAGYDAGRRIIGEMLGISIPYYSVSSDAGVSIGTAAASGEAVLKDAPVRELNETAQLDVAGTAAIIYGFMSE